MSVNQIDYLTKKIEEKYGPTLTLDQAAMIVRRAPTTLRNMMAAGRGPASTRTGTKGPHLFLAPDVAQWLIGKEGSGRGDVELSPPAQESISRRRGRPRMK